MTDVVDPNVIAQAVGPAAQGMPGSDTAIALAKRTQAVTYRLAGMTYAQIADACHYSHHTAARVAVTEALRESMHQQVDELRELENLRLDRQLAAIWTTVLAGDIQAGNLALRLSERRSRLNGLDRPTAINVQPDMSEVHSWVQAVLALSEDGGGDLVTEPDITVIDGEILADDDAVA